ncbi:MAG: flagellar hook-basal body complex protein FliE [Balneolaceae bacterium]|nr:flagellar hook-basal body complex protein FliE [Balneolaceae bacterium]
MPDPIGPIISRLQRQMPGSEGFGDPRQLEIGEIDGEGQSFTDMIRKAINDVDEAQKTADGKVEDVIMGRTDNIHEVMISMEKAQLSFQLMTEVRNKAVETYQELSRMQI